MPTVCFGHRLTVRAPNCRRTGSNDALTLRGHSLRNQALIQSAARPRHYTAHPKAPLGQPLVRDDRDIARSCRDLGGTHSCHSKPGTRLGYLRAKVSHRSCRQMDQARSRSSHSAGRLERARRRREALSRSSRPSGVLPGPDAVRGASFAGGARSSQSPRGSSRVFASSRRACTGEVCRDGRCYWSDRPRGGSRITLTPSMSRPAAGASRSRGPAEPKPGLAGDDGPTALERRVAHPRMVNAPGTCRRQGPAGRGGVDRRPQRVRRGPPQAGRLHRPAIPWPVRALPG